MEKKLNISGRSYEAQHVSLKSNSITLHLNGMEHSFDYHYDSEGRLYLTSNGKTHRALAESTGKKGITRISIGRNSYLATEESGHSIHSQQALGGYFAPMTATVKNVMVKAGDKVKSGQPLIVIEAMKLQISIEAKAEGIVEELCCKSGELVAEGIELLRIKNDK